MKNIFMWATCDYAVSLFIFLFIFVAIFHLLPLVDNLRLVIFYQYLLSLGIMEKSDFVFVFISYWCLGAVGFISVWGMWLRLHDEGFVYLSLGEKIYLQGRQPHPKEQFFPFRVEPTS